MRTLIAADRVMPSPPSLDFDELRGVLRGVVRSLRAIGFARLLMVNGHGGNVEPLAVAARELAHEFGLPVIACTGSDMGWPAGRRIRACGNGEAAPWLGMPER